MAARALQFLTMTAARSGEVRGMTWAEVDLDKALWIVPAARMKAGREHRVPLTGEAVAFCGLPRMEGSPYVFFAPRGGKLSDMTLSAVMRRMQETEEKAGGRATSIRVRAPGRAPRAALDVPRLGGGAGLRSRHGRDGAGPHVGSEVERAYRRTDMLERRRAMMRLGGLRAGGEQTLSSWSRLPDANCDTFKRGRIVLRPPPPPTTGAGDEPSEGVRLVTKALLEVELAKLHLPRMAKKGRPRVLDQHKIDCCMAEVIYEAAKHFPGEMSISGWIDAAKLYCTDKANLHRYFRTYQTGLNASVSRGLRSLGVSRVERKRVFGKSRTI